MALGSCMPSRVNTTPFRANDSTFHTLCDTIESSDMAGPILRSVKIVMVRPAATTARMPLTPRPSDTR